jgi:hypothetical protein
MEASVDPKGASSTRSTKEIDLKFVRREDPVSRINNPLAYRDILSVRCPDIRDPPTAGRDISTEYGPFKGKMGGWM